MREVPRKGGGRELPLSHADRVTAPLTRGALGSPAPVKQLEFDGGKNESLSHKSDVKAWR